jgi:hypothetical protein
MQNGRAREAALTFDALAADPRLDRERRADVLFWSARAHAEAGEMAEAERAAAAVGSVDPGSWHASDAALLLGRVCLARGDVVCARTQLRRAATSSKPAVRSEAEGLLRQLATAPAP